MNAPVTSEECPCCHGRLEPGADTDRAFVITFLAGMAARDLEVPIAASLCEKHSRIASEASAFLLAAFGGRKS